MCKVTVIPVQQLLRGLGGELNVRPITQDRFIAERLADCLWDTPRPLFGDDPVLGEFYPGGPVVEILCLQSGIGFLLSKLEMKAGTRPDGWTLRAWRTLSLAAYGAICSIMSCLSADYSPHMVSACYTAGTNPRLAMSCSIGGSKERKTAVRIQREKLLDEATPPISFRPEPRAPEYLQGHCAELITFHLWVFFLVLKFPSNNILDLARMRPSIVQAATGGHEAFTIALSVASLIDTRTRTVLYNQLLSTATSQSLIPRLRRMRAFNRLCRNCEALAGKLFPLGTNLVDFGG
ncbi:hypothetical protein C8J57DRAFT_1223584 [Mycena rebaudengoi]|nr:hypothetical protein C8J57DRAFT_1223584 [Mycena rebaudengoi]